MFDNDRADKPKNYIPGLDGLRAVAILAVIVAHTLNEARYPRIVGVGKAGVLVFFALSGFLITTRLLAEYEKSGRISLWNFYVRRTFRILPPALIYLGVIAILAKAGMVTCSWQAIRSALLFYNNYTLYGDAGYKVGHFWSLCVEEHFYLVWPALLIVFGVRKGLRTSVILTVVIIFVRLLDDRYRLLAHLIDSPATSTLSYRTDLVADTLLWGCSLAFYLRYSFKKRKQEPRFDAHGLCSYSSTTHH